MALTTQQYSTLKSGKFGLSDNEDQRVKTKVIAEITPDVRRRTFVVKVLIRVKMMIEAGKAKTKLII